MRNGKYGVANTADRTWNGKVYDSKIEMQYRKHLEILKKASDPKDRVEWIIEQKPWQIIINGILICKYLLDFEVKYVNGRIEYIDVKGVRTDVYIIKKKLVEAKYNIKIKEIIKGQF